MEEMSADQAMETEVNRGESLVTFASKGTKRQPYHPFDSQEELDQEAENEKISHINRGFDVSGYSTSQWQEWVKSKKLRNLGGEAAAAELTANGEFLPWLYSQNQPFYDLAYADDTALIAGTAKKAEQLLHILQKVAAHSNLHLNLKKCVLPRSPASHNTVHFTNGTPLTIEQHAKYLGVTLSSDGSSHRDVSHAIGRASQASATFSHDKDNLRIALKGAPAAVDKAHRKVSDQIHRAKNAPMSCGDKKALREIRSKSLRVRQSWAWIALKDDGIAMLPAPLEINPAPKGSSVDFPQVIFSARTAPKWKITLSDAGTQLEILRLEFSPRYAEVEAATQVASFLPVRSFVHVDPAIALFGHSRARSLSVLDFAGFDSTPFVRSAACLDFRPSVFGRSQLGPATSALDFLCSGAFLSPKSSACSNSTALISDHGDSGSPLALRSLA
eukprot:s397_g31.t1